MEEKSCKQCGVMFTITDGDKDFLDKVSPTFAGKKYSIPSPKLCPDCRQQRRLAFRNERNLYKRKCDMSGKDIISIYRPESYVAYHLDERFSDKRDGINYGKEIDFSRSILQQFQEIFVKVPKRALTNGRGSENSEYTNGAGVCKNCYLIFNGSHNESCYYGSGISRCKDCIDNFGIENSDILYECIDCIGCHKSRFLQNCEECRDSAFLKNCKNCDRCFGCVNLCNAQYHIFNKAYLTKDAYDKKLAEIGRYSRDEFVTFCKDFPVVNLSNINADHCLGNNISHSKDAINSYNIYNAQNVSYGYDTANTDDCRDISSIDGYVAGGCSKIYQSGYIFEQSSDLLFTLHSWNNCHHLIYCIECRLSKDCFACTGLRNKQYCILNKQYTQEEYETLVPQLIEKMQAEGERGELFPSSLSPFGYNETVAQEFFPLTKQEAEKKGFNRSDYEAPFPKGDGKDVVICEVSQKPFRLIPQELEFYKKHNLPYPTKHPDVRHAERMKLRNPRKLFDRTCAKCGIDIKTTYAPERPEIVYCEACYNKEIYG